MWLIDHLCAINIIPAPKSEMLLLLLVFISFAFASDDSKKCIEPEDVTMANLNYYATRDYKSNIFDKSVHKLHIDWNISLCGSSISAPSIVNEKVWSGDFGGCLTSVKIGDGAVVNQKNLSADFVLPDKIYARVTMTHNVKDKSVFTVTNGIIGNRTGYGTWLLKLREGNMSLIWKKKISDSIWMVATTSPFVKDGFVYVPLSSSESGSPLGGFTCCESIGRVIKVRALDGEIIWNTPMAPPGLVGVGLYSGVMIWGTPVMVKELLIVPTGQIYQVPASVSACANSTHPSNWSSCVDKAVRFDSIVSININSGSIIASKQTVIGIDAWNVDCFLGRAQCPKGVQNSDYDASGIVYSEKQNLLYVYNKAGSVLSLDLDLKEKAKRNFNNTGGIFGGFVGSAALRDHKDRSQMKLVLPLSNGDYKPWVLPNGTTIYSGAWICLDGHLNIKWIRPVPGVGFTPQLPGKVPADNAYGSVSISNNVVLGFSRGGLAVFMNLQTGSISWQIFIGGSMSGSCSFYGNAIVCTTGPGGNPFSGALTSPGPVSTATSPQRTLLNAWWLIKFEL